MFIDRLKYPPPILFTTKMSLIPMNMNRKVVYLPYDIVNVIFDYISHMTDSGWILDVDNNGKVRLLARPLFASGIHPINHFKQNAFARYVQLQIIIDNTHHQLVDALEQPYRLHNQARIEENYQNGIISDCRCYKYIDHPTGIQMTAYVESRYARDIGVHIFHQGCVYDNQGNSYIISGFGSNGQPNSVTISINSTNMVWDYNDDEINEIAQALIELNEIDDEIAQFYNILDEPIFE
jgi:hypothetical protein